MTKKIRCENCHGWGVLKDRWIKCNICHGKGFNCKTCKGKGKVLESCHLCGGAGWYKNKKEKKPTYGSRR